MEDDVIDLVLYRVQCISFFRNDKNAIKKEEGVGVMQIIKLFMLPLAFIVPQANAVTIDNYLDRSNVLLDDVSYVQVTINDSIASAGDIDFRVEQIASTPIASNSNFDPSQSIDSSIPDVTALEVIILFGAFLIVLAAFAKYKRSI